MRQASFRYFLLPLFFLLACVGVYAQANSEVTGIVTDQTGAVVAGAKIVLTDPATGTVKTTASGATGLYDIPGLNNATYNMKVTAKGFEAYAQNGIVVNVSSTIRADIKLTVGAETQTVTVEADALAVQSDSNVVSTLISSEQISEIATENRNFAALAALGLGVSSTLPDSNTPTSVASSFSISVNGLRENHNIWLIDGGEADDRGGAGGMDIMPSQDAIAEFTMMTSNYPPDYGIASGATMSLSLKSGTQKYHGEGFEFNRNTDYDANNYFNKYNTTTPTPRQVLNYNIFGFNIGGPLYIPKLYNQHKDKTFFFWNEEWRKLNQGNSPNVVNTIPTQDIPTAGSDLTYMSPLFTSASTDSNGITTTPGIVVPFSGAKATAAGIQNVYFEPCLDSSLTTATQRDTCQAGILSSYKLTPGSPFPNNVIPHQLFDPNAILYLNAGILPKPNKANGQAVSEAQTPITVRDDVLRVDHKITDKWQLMGHYMHDSVTQAYGGPELGWDWYSYNTITSVLSNPSNSAALKLSGTITPNLLVESSINYDGNIINITNSANGNRPAGWSVNSFFDLSKTAQGKFVGQKSLPSMNGFGNPYGTAEQIGNAPWHNAAEDYEPKVDVSYTVGKHAMKFGFSYNRYTKNQQVNGDTQGTFSWGGTSNGQFTGNLVYCSQSKTIAIDNQKNCYQGDGTMDMLLGMASGYDQTLAAPINHYVNQTPSAYALDNWHVTPRLTLQLGLRYDALPHAWERNNLLSNFDPGNFTSSATPLWKSDGSMDSTGPGFQNFTVAGVNSPHYLNGMRIAGQAGFPRGIVTNDYRTLQPRVGFSEDLFGNGKTVLRGGFGTFYERLQGNDVYNAATDAPFANDPGASYVNMTNPHQSNQTGLIASTPFFTSGLQSLSLNYRAPAVAQFSLGVQRELAPSMIWVIQYVGNLAWHQSINRNINNFPLSTDMGVRSAGGNVTAVGGVPLPTSGQGNVANNSNSFRTYGGWGGINEYDNNTNGNYNGFQTGLRLQNKWGLSGELDYTWSHEIDLQSGDLAGISNPWYPKYDKGAGSYDRRQMLNLNYMYKLPFFEKSNGLVHSIAGGWEIAGTAIFETGVPVVNAYGGNDTIGLGGGYTNRMNATGKTSYTKKVTAWFDTSKFSAPTPAWQGGQNQGFGNAGKDIIVGPGRVNFTTSLYKSFAITERAHFELRVESFNTFNHTQFNGIDVKGPVANNSDFGHVQNTQDPRVLEMGGKFVF